jgi:hypothetical protein
MKKKQSTETLNAILFVSKYPRRNIPFAFLSMAIFRIPLGFNRRIVFYKLMGCGKNGSFDIRPDLRQWALMIFFKADSSGIKSLTHYHNEFPGRFISSWWRFCGVNSSSFLLEPFAGHGSWDGQTFVKLGQELPNPEGKVAILTRATIRLSKLREFWRAVPATSFDLGNQQALEYSVGIGEVPFIKQATFSIWSSLDGMKNYAYKHSSHKDVIRKTRVGKWYAEEMFLRFKVLDANTPQLKS